MKLKTILQKFEETFPLSHQEKWDHCGLNLGSREQEIRAVLFSYDICHEVIRYATQKKCHLIISHHPFRLSGNAEIDLDSYDGQTIALAIKNRIALYSCHTVHDRSAHSLNHYYLKQLGIKTTRPLLISSGNLFKLAVFIPVKHTEKVMSAMFSAGGGGIGNYDECSFRVAGTGTFRGNEMSRPKIGKKNVRENVEENRVEILVPQENLKNVLQAMRQAHPYEEVAYDVYPLQNERSDIGLGAIGDLEKSITKPRLLAALKRLFKTKTIRFVDNGRSSFRRIAICTGSGSSLIEEAVQNQADLFITGDVKYHQAIEAKRQNLAIADVGHFYSEVSSVTILKQRFDQMFGKALKTYEYNGLRDAFELI